MAQIGEQDPRQGKPWCAAHHCGPQASPHTRENLRENPEGFQPPPLLCLAQDLQLTGRGMHPGIDGRLLLARPASKRLGNRELAWSHLTFQLDLGSKSTRCFPVRMETHRPCVWNDRVFPDTVGSAVLPRTEGPTLWLSSPDSEAPEMAAPWGGTGEAVGLGALSYLWMKFIANSRSPCFVQKLFGADMPVFPSLEVSNCQSYEASVTS